jgi:LPS-assembly protein
MLRCLNAFSLLLCGALTIGCACFSAWAQPILAPNQPVYMEAQRLGVDEQNAIVVALGDVRVRQGDSVLHADRITYYQQRNIVRASGNVRVEDHQRGGTYYADEVELKDDLLQGVIANFRVRLADNSQFAARRAERVDESTIKLEKAVYSPCLVCEDKSPFWQIRAQEVTIDDAAQKVSYEDVTLQMMGVPVFYTPLFSHPTPNADAKSGFLAPSFSNNSNLGITTKTPYYFAISPDRDATLTPYLTSKEGPVLIGEYRQLFDQAALNITASGTYPYDRNDQGARLDNRQFRGHLFSDARISYAQHWESGYDINLASDDTYLLRYGFGSQRSLTSRLFTEGRDGRNYALLEGIAFQGLDARSRSATQPYILPLAEAHMESDAGLFNIAGLRHFTHANTQNIYRREELTSRRVSVGHGFTLPYITQGGHLLDLGIEQQLDYIAAEQKATQTQSAISDDRLRYIPTASARWRLPLIQHTPNAGSITLEPTVLAVARPNGGNRAAPFANEDNLTAELHDANLFSVNPFPGYDTVDDGSRIAYGMNGHWWLGQGRDLFFVLGQNYSFNQNTPFPYSDEPNTHFSDYIGRLSVSLDPIEVHYRMRASQHNFDINKHSINLRANLSPITLDATYLSFADDPFWDKRKEIYAAARLGLTDHWSVHGNARRNLALNEMVSAGLGFTYQNECFTLETAFSRAFVEDRDLRKDTAFHLRVLFANLTEL